MERTPELVVDARCYVGEGPAWDARDGALLWVDIVPGDVFHLSVATGALQRMRLDQEVTAVIPRASGGYVLALQDGVFAVDRIEQGAPLHPVQAIELDLPDHRLNDAKCDPHGRLWGGTLARDGSAGAGALYRLDADLALTRVVAGVTLSNGLGWSPDATRMYYADSAPRTLDVFDFDLASGTVSNRARFADIPADVGAPDGLAVDAEGGVWLAVWSSGAVYRYTPEGDVADVIPLPAKNVASCCFGGPDLTDLYVTTASVELDERERAADPHAGGVYRLRPGVRGLPTTAFAG
jgi:sugar lactone lactonase YvrE